LWQVLRAFDVSRVLRMVIFSSMQNFRMLRVWQQAHAVSLEVYRDTRGFPAAERYGLMTQIRRAAVSICANIAEGCGRGSRRELMRFLYIAHGSASELECELILSAELGFLQRSDHARLEASIIQVKRMLGGLIRRLRQRDAISRGVDR
jgi:four helix bundle protein